MRDNLDQRILAAIRPLDAPSGLPVTAPLQLQADGVSFIRNRRNLYVITAAPGLAAHVVEFETPPATPAIGSVSITITITDPGGQYLSRQVSVQLPRDPDPAHASQPSSLFQSIDVVLYPAPAAAVESGWAVVRSIVTNSGNGQGIGGALLRVIRTSDSQVLARGLSDARGEALVPVPGIPITTWDSGTEQVFATAVSASLEVYSPQVPSPVPDPDALEAQRAALISKISAINLSRGQTVVVPVSLALS